MTDKELGQIGSFDILLNMFFIYSCILHSSIVVINIGIILKEFDIEFFEMFKENAGTGSDYNLSVNRVVEDLEEELWWENPVKLFKALFEFILGETVTEEIDKHPEIAPGWDSMMDSLGDEMTNYG